MLISGTRSISDASMGCHPGTEELSKATPAVKTPGSKKLVL
ncbi:hypothetical protein EPHNCH_0007 [Anaplasma phagocytophilum str. NCH-1]|uniref:Uncharacterized protein n=1 Tax=Anaplasma phagocytophilum str. NCH-1 TaxID=1359161 RepID=A0A0F3NLQ5_ANAPH|nr:hypothetical protein EPHNCH_0007 [Anaplasma phagocytophilum str. NCH-1]